MNLFRFLCIIILFCGLTTLLIVLCNKNYDTASPQIQVNDVIQHSICSESATLRGSHQKVLSFSFYGKDQNFMDTPYFKGIRANLLLMNKFYPDFIMRIYHNFNSIDNFNDLLIEFPNLDLFQNLPIYGDISRLSGSIWRFAAMADPLIDEWHSRDLDSRIGEREVSAVNDWRLNSNASYHVMRDHLYHNTEILAGMFGMRLTDKNREQNLRIFEAMLNSKLEQFMKGVDQRELTNNMWPVARFDMVCHDSYLCEKFVSLSERLCRERNLMISILERL